jgi:hypothetical protein
LSSIQISPDIGAYIARRGRFGRYLKMMAAGEVSYLRRFAGKFVEVVAAAIGTAVGGYLIAYVTGHFSFSMLPGFAPKPQQTVSAPAPTPDKVSIETTVRAALANHHVSEARPPVATSPGTPQPTTPAAPVLPATASASTIAVAPPLAPAEIKTLPVAAAADPPHTAEPDGWPHGAAPTTGRIGGLPPQPPPSNSDALTLLKRFF